MSNEEQLKAEVARLKAEVERLKADNEQFIEEAHEADQERDHAMSANARLKAEVERLTKLCQATSPDGFIHIRDINAAKEGKPSA